MLNQRGGLLMLHVVHRFQSQQERHPDEQTKQTLSQALQYSPVRQVSCEWTRQSRQSRRSVRIVIIFYTILGMPKVIDKYVLEDKIGNGQFGEVFRGRHQDTMEVVAIKTIKRDMIKGKFYELLQNEIKVLKSCDNAHIIKLLALKKTPHNYYLMLEYCNGGDMLAKVKEQGTIPQQLVLKYATQIFNAFQTLVNSKIMHRDFKLANILLHDGNIKIADFGFAKLLAGEDYTSTMLGSPLNMAPQVLGNSKYNSKADIWSIGACLYQMIYGKPPYVAGNMVDLLKLIKSKPLTLPTHPKICPELADVIKKMLVADVKRRIQWHELFKHPVNTILTRKQIKEAELQLVEDESLMLNTSKCYLKNNLVLNDVSGIKENSQMNEYLVDIIKTGKKPPLKQEIQHEVEDIQEVSKSNRHNSKIILHYRNIYAFIASVADTIVNRTEDEHYQIAAYVLVRKILHMIEWVLASTEGECTIKGITHWKKYAKSPQFQEIRQYVEKQLDVFSVFNKSLEPVIKKNALEGLYDTDVRELLSGPFKQATYIKYLGIFLKTVARSASSRALIESNLVGGKNDWKLLYYGLKIIHPQASFGTGQNDFDFKAFYESFQSIDEQRMLQEVERGFLSLKK